MEREHRERLERMARANIPPPRRDDPPPRRAGPGDTGQARESEREPGAWLAGGKLVLALEGGYSLEQVPLCVAACARALLGDAPTADERAALDDAPASACGDAGRDAIDETIAAHAEHSVLVALWSDGCPTLEAKRKATLLRERGFLSGTRTIAVSPTPHQPTARGRSPARSTSGASAAPAARGKRAATSADPPMAGGVVPSNQGGGDGATILK